MTDTRRDVADAVQRALKALHETGGSRRDAQILVRLHRSLRSEGREPDALTLPRDGERAILAAMNEIEGAVNVVYARLADLRGTPSDSPISLDRIEQSERELEAGEGRDLREALGDLSDEHFGPSDSPTGEPYHATDREGNRWTYREAVMAADAHGCVLVPEVSFERMKRRAFDSPEREDGA